MCGSLPLGRSTGTVPRLGRKTRLSKEQRGLLWPIFERVRADLDERALVTMPVISLPSLNNWNQVGSGRSTSLLWTRPRT